MTDTLDTGKKIIREVKTCRESAETIRDLWRLVTKQGAAIERLKLQVDTLERKLERRGDG